MLTPLTPSLRSRLDFVQATKDELAEPLDMLPSRVVERATVGREKEYAALAEAKTSQALDVEAAETVLAPKATDVGRYRPITALQLLDRVLLRALTNELADDMPAFDRSFEAQQAFQRCPLDSGEPYVVVADVSAFYFFVDHQLLASRLIDATAQADAAEATRAVLDAVIGRPYGLPQNFVPSMLLSEAFIAPVERRLLRAGLRVFRSNDDFRISANSWGDALQALERLQEEVNRVGLDLNSEKSRILKLDTYSSNFGLTDKLVAEALTAADPDLPDIDPYTGEPVEGEDDAPDDEYVAETEAPEAGEGPEVGNDDDIAEAALRLLEVAAAQRLRDQRMNGFERAANRHALQIALLHLTRARSDAGVKEASQVLAVEPLLTRPFVSYLRALGAEGPVTCERIQDVLGRFRGHAPFWPQAWLANALLDPHVSLTESVQAWLEDLLESRAPAVLRVRAALALAFHGKLSANVIAETLDGLAPAARPDAVAAMALARGTRASRSRRNEFADDRLLQWVYETADKHRKDPGPLL